MAPTANMGNWPISFRILTFCRKSPMKFGNCSRSSLRCFEHCFYAVLCVWTWVKTLGSSVVTGKLEGSQNYFRNMKYICIQKLLWFPLFPFWLPNKINLFHKISSIYRHLMWFYKYKNSIQMLTISIWDRKSKKPNNVILEKTFEKTTSTFTLF